MVSSSRTSSREWDASSGASLGAGIELLLGPAFAGAGWQLFPESSGLLIALLPPGAFVLLGLMLALANARAASRRRAACGRDAAAATVAPP